MLPLVLSDRIETVAVRTLIFAIMAVGWNLMSGYGGMFSFGHAAFFGIGAYTDAYLLDRARDLAVDLDGRRRRCSPRSSAC